jgi:hypothetical protein
MRRRHVNAMIMPFWARGSPLLRLGPIFAFAEIADLDPVG